MHAPAQAESDHSILKLLLAAGSVLGLFLWQGDQGFSFWDEGFLWYGAQRVVLGEVPIRDFMAYDPGRYYWSALFMKLWNDDGIMALRAAAALFQTLGLFIGLKILGRDAKRPNYLYLLVAVVTLAFWMFPREKLFDVSLSIGLIGILSHLVDQPSKGRYFLTGVVVGLVAVFGRNHGVYGVAASLGTLSYLMLQREARAGFVAPFAIWMLGVVTGYAPVLFMLVVIPGFASFFWEGILFLFESGATNIPLPIPWPWLVSFDPAFPMTAIHGVLTGCFFVALAVYGVASLVWVLRRGFGHRPVPAIAVACAFLALPYAHYAYSRPDIVHLAQGIFPFLIGSLALLATQPRHIKWPFTALLCTASLAVMMPVQPGAQCHISLPCADADVGGDRLRIAQVTANNLLLLETLATDYAAGDRSFIVTPLWPGAYAALGRRSPMWENYALFERSEAFQRDEIERIEDANPGFALIIDFALDGREEMRFGRTHPVIHDYIRENFDPHPGFSQYPHYQIYVKQPHDE